MFFYRGMWFTAAEVNLSYGLYLGGHECIVQEQFCVFEEIDVARLGFLEFSHKHSEVSHDSILVPCSDIFPILIFFKPKMSRVVLF